MTAPATRVRTAGVASDTRARRPEGDTRDRGPRSAPGRRRPRARGPRGRRRRAARARPWRRRLRRELARVGAHDDVGSRSGTEADALRLRADHDALRGERRRRDTDHERTVETLRTRIVSSSVKRSNSVRSRRSRTTPRRGRRRPPAARRRAGRSGPRRTPRRVEVDAGPTRPGAHGARQRRRAGAPSARTQRPRRRRCRRARPADRAEANLSLVPAPGSEVGTATPAATGRA